MKFTLFLLLFLQLLLGAAFAQAQELYYGTGQWDPQGLGNHRAVIYAEEPADAVYVKIPWRRLDDVEDKNVILTDALTGQRVNNIFCATQNNDYADVVFQPVSGEGIHYLYYMPGRVTGRWWHPD